MDTINFLHIYKEPDNTTGDLTQDYTVGGESNTL